jgi:hypothetical protein
MLRPTSMTSLRISLSQVTANRTKPTSRHVRSNVANGVKADNICSV